MTLLFLIARPAVQLLYAPSVLEHFNLQAPKHLVSALQGTSTIYLLWTVHLVLMTATPAIALEIAWAVTQPSTLESWRIVQIGAFLWTDTSKAMLLCVVNVLVLALSALRSPTAQLAQSDISSTLWWISVTLVPMIVSLVTILVVV